EAFRPGRFQGRGGVGWVDRGGHPLASCPLERDRAGQAARVHPGRAVLRAWTTRMSPTPEGRRLLDYTERLLALAEEARADLSAHPPRGRLLIGAMESTAAVHLPRLLSTLHAKYPALDVHLVTATSGVLMARVRAGDLSAAFVAGDVAEPGLVADVAFVEELVLVTHPSVRRPGADELRGRTLVTFGA